MKKSKNNDIIIKKSMSVDINMLKDIDNLYSIFINKKHTISEYNENMLLGIGRLVVSFQKLELTIKYGIESLLPKHYSDDYIHLFLNSMSFKNINEVFHLLINRTKWKECKYIKRFSRVIEYAENERNKIVHSYWKYSTRVKNVNKKKNGNIESLSENYNDTELIKLAIGIDKISECILILISDYNSIKNMEC